MQDNIYYRRFMINKKSKRRSDFDCKSFMYVYGTGIYLDICLNILKYIIKRQINCILIGNSVY